MKIRGCSKLSLAEIVSFLGMPSECLKDHRKESSKMFVGFWSSKDFIMIDKVIPLLLANQNKPKAK